MFQRTEFIPYENRSVGVIEHKESKVNRGYNLINIGRETVRPTKTLQKHVLTSVKYLLDCDGRVVHEWTSPREVFVSYLRENGNLVRDG